MYSEIPENHQPTPSGNAPVAHLLRGLDIVGQIVFAYLALTTLGFESSGADNARATMFRLPLVIWQMISLVLSSIAYEGIRGRSFHGRIVWPVLGSLMICAVFMPFGIGRFLLWFWFQAVTFLSIPYLVITIVMFFRYSGDFVMSRKAISVHKLFLLKQTDLIAQLLCIAIPLILTLRVLRPIHESLLLAYPVLAGWQLISAGVNTWIWRDMTPWRSGLRIPQMFLQAVFGGAVLIQLCVNDRFSWNDALYQPCAQMLVGAYLLMSYQEWEKLSSGVAFQRRAAPADQLAQARVIKDPSSVTDTGR